MSEAEELAAWAFAARNDAPLYYQAFIESFPQSKFTALAKVRLEHQNKIQAKRGLAKQEANKILALVSDMTGAQIVHLASNRRTRQLARYRQIAMYLMRDHSRLTFVQIGRLLGGKDHTTVMHAIRKLDELRASGAEPETIKMLDTIARKLDEPRP